MPGPNTPQTHNAWHYVDRNGGDHVVDRWEDVPPEYRDRALKVGTEPVPLGITMGTPKLRLDPAWDDWHVPSFVAGAGLMLVVVLVVQLARGMAGRLLWKLLLAGVVATVLGVAYLNLLASQVKGAGFKLQSPQQIILDTQRARDDANQQNTNTQKMLKQVE